MADDDQIHDEYQLADLDGLSTESVNPSQEAPENVHFPEQKPYAHKTNLRRNALIAVSLFIFAIVAYKFISSHSSKKTTQITKTTTQVPLVQKTPQVAAQPAFQAATPAMPAAQSQTSLMDNKINQKLSALELNQQSMRADFTNVNNQLNGINSNVNEIMTKMTEISRVVTNLSALAEAQSKEIERMVTVKAKKIQRQVALLPALPPLKYYIQAVIPGRAWLIATNGNSITVRVGSIVSGYGVVKFIDAAQGRVMMSSGQTIRFSQSDS